MFEGDRIEEGRHEVLTSFEEEMALNDIREARRRIPQLLEHGPSNGRLTNVGIVLQGLSRASGRATSAFITGFVEIRFRHEDERLNGNEHLEAQ